MFFQRNLVKERRLVSVSQPAVEKEIKHQEKISYLHPKQQKRDVLQSKVRLVRIM